MPWDIWLIFFLLGVIVPWRGRYRLRELLSETDCRRPGTHFAVRLNNRLPMARCRRRSMACLGSRLWRHPTRFVYAESREFGRCSNRRWQHACHFAVAQSAPYGPYARKDARKVTSSRGENSAPLSEGARSVLCIGRDGGHLRGILVSGLRDGCANSLGIASLDHGRDIVLAVRNRSSLSRTKRASGNHAFGADFRDRSRRLQQPDSSHGLARCCGCCCCNCWATLSD